MKKKRVWSLALLMGIGILAGCGNNNTSSDRAATAADRTTEGENTQTASKGDYPKGPVTIVVPYGAGGGTDLFCRVVADKMSQTLGTSFEVTNLTGGGGTIGATDVANAQPDGYKLGFCISAPLAVMPLYGETSYQLEDCQTICGAYSTLNVLAVSADSPIQNVEDLVAYIEENNGALSYGGSGTGNIQHLTIEEWFQQAGTKDWNMTCVAYTDGDSAEAVALMSGEVPFAIMQSQGVKSYVEDNSLRVLMVFGEDQPKWMKDQGLDIPTTKDLGYSCTIAPLIGFWGPKGISQEVIDAISNAFYEATKDPETQKAIENLGLEFDYRTAEEYQKALEDLEPVAEELLKQLGMIDG